MKQAHSLHIWSLTLNKIALAAHLVLGEGNLHPATPKNIKYEAVKEDLGDIDGCSSETSSQSTHLVPHTQQDIALAAHLVLGEGNLRFILH